MEVCKEYLKRPVELVNLYHWSTARFNMIGYGYELAKVMSFVAEAANLRLKNLIVKQEILFQSVVNKVDMIVNVLLILSRSHK